MLCLSEAISQEKKEKKKAEMWTGLEQISQRSSTYRPASYDESCSYPGGTHRSSSSSFLVDPVRRDDDDEPSATLLACSDQSEILERGDFWCPRCARRMTEARILECLHPICTPCIDELLDRDGRCDENSEVKWEYCWQGEEEAGLSSSGGNREGCPICDNPLPHRGSPRPPPHYPLQHRLVMDAVRRRLTHHILCCDLCPEEVQASVHCPTCLGNYCVSCGQKHEINEISKERLVGRICRRHEVGPLWEAKRFRRTALCLEHPSHSLRFHCIACQQVTCRECMWRGSHRGHASEGASGAGRRATNLLISALQRARNLLNSLLIEYNNGSSENDSIFFETSIYNTMRNNNRYSDEFSELTFPFRTRSNIMSYTREAQERIHEFARLQRARYLLDAISLGEELLSEGSDVEILSLSRIILKRLQILGTHLINEIQLDNLDKLLSRPKHTGIFHCCTFCSSGGKKEAICACPGTMPGEYRGCGHGHPGHPRANHWSCCGSIKRHGSCLNLPKFRYQLVL